jgi:hypothetical protein
MLKSLRREVRQAQHAFVLRSQAENRPITQEDVNEAGRKAEAKWFRNNRTGVTRTGGRRRKGRVTRRIYLGGATRAEVCEKIYAAASENEANAIYKKAALQFHPDKGGDPEDMKAINDCIGRKRDGLGPRGSPAPRPAAPAPAQPAPAQRAPPPPNPDTARREKLTALDAHRALTRRKNHRDMIRAAIQNDVHRMEELLNDPVSKEVINQEYYPTDSPNGSILCTAAKYGNTEIVRLLLQVPCIDVNKRAGNNATAISIAAMKGHTDIVRLLLGAKNIELNGASSAEPLYSAYASEKPPLGKPGDRKEIIELLINAGAVYNGSYS